MNLVDLQWRPMDDKRAQAALGAVLKSWESTPYMPGQDVKGVGVDCIRFVVKVMDELNGTTTEVRTLPGDVCVHAPGIAQAGLDRLVGQFGLLPAGPQIEPGDLLVTGPEGGGPGHVKIVGDRKNVLWHTSAHGVCQVGIGMTGMLGGVLFAVYRMPLRWWGPK